MEEAGAQRYQYCSSCVLGLFLDNRNKHFDDNGGSCSSDYRSPIVAVKFSNHHRFVSKSHFPVSLSDDDVSYGGQQSIVGEDDFSDYFLEEMENDEEHQMDITIEAEMASKRNAKMIALMRGMFTEDGGLAEINCSLLTSIGLYTLEDMENADRRIALAKSSLPL